MQPLLIKGAPFHLEVTPGEVDPQRAVAVGAGTVGGTVGAMLSYSILLRDIHNNPTHLRPEEELTTDVQLIDRLSGALLRLDSLASMYEKVNGNVTKITYSYNISRAGQYWMHIRVTKRALSYSVGGNNLVTTSTPIEHAIIGSPFSIYMSPEQADAVHTVCKGAGIRQATVSRTSTFEIALSDEYRNGLIIGGNKFFVRVYGDAAYQRRDMAVVPDCMDRDSGKYTCRYTPTFNGTHQLTIKLLHPGLGQSVNPVPHSSLLPPSSINGRRPGGGGLFGRYYSSKDGALHAMQAHTVDSGGDSDVVSPTVPIAVQIDPVVSFKWAYGFMVPSRTLDEGTGVASLELQNAGQTYTPTLLHSYTYILVHSYTHTLI